MAIRMEPQQLRDLASYLLNVQSQVEDLINAMDARIDSDTAAWDGASKQSYFEGYEQIKPTLTQTFPQVIHALSDRLNLAANQIQSTDENIAAGFRG